MEKIIKKDIWKTAVWAGGETNELFIYPPNSDYSTRNFKARISIANTKDDKLSTFTSLPGVDRFISIIDGEAKLSHDNHYDIELNKFQIERFKGDWETKSLGKYKDFNLMLKNVRGDLYFRDINSNCKLHLEKESDICFLYVIENSLKVNGNIVKNEELFLTDNNILDIELYSENNTKIFYGFIKEWEK